ncbi:hypothetical protein GS489_06680 [Rhodococcus hoagii]|nr:hypothetical protein [Prescottella equi]
MSSTGKMPTVSDFVYYSNRTSTGDAITLTTNDWVKPAKSTSSPSTSPRSRPRLPRSCSRQRSTTHRAVSSLSIMFAICSSAFSARTCCRPGGECG